jgi:TonB family protein
VSASLRGTAAVEIAGTPVACQIVEVPLSNFSLPVNLNGTVRIYHVTEGTRTLCIDRTRHSVLRDEFHQVLAAGETARAAVNVSGTFTYTSFERDLDLSRELFRFQPPAGSVDDHKLAPAQPGALLFGPLLASGPPVFRIGGGVSVPRTIHKVKPRYDKEARRKHIQGTVVLLCVIDPDGLPRNFQIVRSLDPGLDQEAIKAVSAWRFEPGRKDGQPVAVIAAVEVNFRLLDDPPL